MGECNYATLCCECNYATLCYVMSECYCCDYLFLIPLVSHYDMCNLQVETCYHLVFSFKKVFILRDSYYLRCMITVIEAMIGDWERANGYTGYNNMFYT